MDGATANARRKYHHVHYGGKLTENDIAGMVRGMENKDAEIARLTDERDQALARATNTQAQLVAILTSLAEDMDNGHSYNAGNHVRSYIPADAQEALDKMLTDAQIKAYAEGKEAGIMEAEVLTTLAQMLTDRRL